MNRTIFKDVLFKHQPWGVLASREITFQNDVMVCSLKLSMTEIREYVRV